MRGPLACTLPWRLGQLPAFAPDLVQAVDPEDRLQRRRVGECLFGVGILFLQPSVSPCL